MQREKLLVFLASVKRHVDREGGWAIEDGQRMMPHVGAAGKLRPSGRRRLRRAHRQARPSLHGWKVSVLARMGLSFDLSTASGKLMHAILTVTIIPGCDCDCVGSVQRTSIVGRRGSSRHPRTR
jgi:predicted TIM-barrel fold metal-dependent hydrolase